MLPCFARLRGVLKSELQNIFKMSFKKDTDITFPLCTKVAKSVTFFGSVDFLLSYMLSSKLFVIDRPKLLLAFASLVGWQVSLVNEADLAN